MNIKTYTFQSPYPNQMQMGKPVPEPQEQKTETQKVESFDNKIVQEAKAYASTMANSNTMNVANSVADGSVANSLSEFTRVNMQVQASQAYSS